MASQLRAIFLFCMIVFLSAPAVARNAVVTVTLAGEAYNGAPQFNLIADDRIIASREVSEALDTATGQRLKLDNLQNRKDSQRFSFNVPDIDNVSRLDIAFVNDAQSADGKAGDRNLYVLAFSIRTVRKSPVDTAVTIREFRPQALKAIGTANKGVEIQPHYAALYREGRLRLIRPAGGWESALQAPAEPEAQAAATPEPVKSAQACNIRPLELARFEKNASELSQAMRDQLAGLKETLANMSCVARVTAFTGGGPSQAFRDSLSQARMRAVATELAAIGMQADKIVMESAKGHGRRVVITFQ